MKQCLKTLNTTGCYNKENFLNNNDLDPEHTQNVMARVYQAAIMSILYNILKQLSVRNKFFIKSNLDLGSRHH